jgi:transcription antitermination factor NusG
MTDVVETAASDVPPTPVNPDMHWYIVHAYSGMEKAVERNIVERITRAGMERKFGRILVPTEEVVEVKNGQKKTTERRLFPGYVFVEMVMAATASPFASANHSVGPRPIGSNSAARAKPCSVCPVPLAMTFPSSAVAPPL